MEVPPNNVNESCVQAKPFLRWAGGKQKLAKKLAKYVLPSCSYQTYYEPFIGAGALFFEIRPVRAVLSDINVDLMNCYQQVAVSPQVVAQLLREHVASDSRDYYYEVRSECTSGLSPEQQAARFIYLNKAAFNGIYRVNRLGVFNVPYGPSPRGPAIPSETALVAASACLRGHRILSGDFAEMLKDASAGDFVYLDPPYPPRSDTAYFTHYSTARFGWEEQVRVADTFADLVRRGCHVMLSNVNDERIVDLYHGHSISVMDVIRWLGSNGDRYRVQEIVVTSYSPPE